MPGLLLAAGPDAELPGDFTDLAAGCLNPLVMCDALGKTGVAGHQPCDADTDQRKGDPVGLEHLCDPAGARACLELHVHFHFLFLPTRAGPGSKLRPRAASSTSAAGPEPRHSADVSR